VCHSSMMLSTLLEQRKRSWLFCGQTQLYRYHLVYSLFNMSAISGNPNFSTTGHQTPVTDDDRRNCSYGTTRCSQSGIRESKEAKGILYGVLQRCLTATFTAFLGREKRSGRIGISILMLDNPLPLKVM